MKKSELQRLIREEIQSVQLEEGFWDNIKAKVTGSAAKGGALFKNLNAVLKGKPGDTVDVEIVKAISLLKTKMKVVPELQKDMDALFPKEVLEKLDPTIKGAIDNYKKSLEGFMKMHTNMMSSLEKLKLNK
jgi:hypothetical protein